MQIFFNAETPKTLYIFSFFKAIFDTTNIFILIIYYIYYIWYYRRNIMIGILYYKCYIYFLEKIAVMEVLDED